MVIINQGRGSHYTKNVDCIPFLAVNNGNARQGPVVLLDATLGLVLDAGLDDIERSVEHGGKSTTDSTSNKVASQVAVCCLYSPIKVENVVRINTNCFFSLPMSHKQ